MNDKAPPAPMIERVAALAMQLGARHLADYGAPRSRHDFTQRQLMACLIVRAYTRTTYRGVVEFLAVSPSVRRELGLEDKLPHYTTLQKFSARSHVLEIAEAMIQTIGQAAAKDYVGPIMAAMDATGLESTTSSPYFETRRGHLHRKWVKLSAIVMCGSLLPLALVLDWGPSNDRRQARALMEKAIPVAVPVRLYADAGYDAEWIHEVAREDWGVQTVIKPAYHGTGLRKGYWRMEMTRTYLRKNQYGRRWGVESFFSGLKRTMGSMLSSRQPAQLLKEAAIRVLAYTLRR
jgi:transposase